MNDDHITAYPLAWPPGKPRTPESDRKYGKFGKRNEKGYGNIRITLSKAIDRVIAEIDRFTKPGRFYRADNVIISTNLTLRLDGLPRSGQKTPDDTGVAVYFELDDKPRCIPCDNYLRIEDNLAAVAATLDALRTIERHGSEMFEAAFSGFTPLPGPDDVSRNNWRSILDNYQGQDIREARRIRNKLMKRHHPDQGGDSDKFHIIDVAWGQAIQELG